MVVGVAQTMHTHVGKCKNTNNKKKIKLGEGKINK
jgi:hypothetical protein